MKEETLNSTERKWIKMKDGLKGGETGRMLKDMMDKPKARLTVHLKDLMMVV
jgi:hypothetical protein